MHVIAIFCMYLIKIQLFVLIHCCSYLHAKAQFYKFKPQRDFAHSVSLELQCAGCKPLTGVDHDILSVLVFIEPVHWPIGVTALKQDSEAVSFNAFKMTLCVTSRALVLTLVGWRTRLCTCQSQKHASNPSWAAGKLKPLVYFRVVH